ncbi:MAG: ATP-dependent zinc metalloprotease FtsH [Bacilli bacterium]
MNKQKINIFALIIILLAVLFIFRNYSDVFPKTEQITYNEFKENYEDYKNVEVKIDVSQFTRNYNISGEYEKETEDGATGFYLIAPYSEKTDAELDELVEAGVEVSYAKTSQLMLIVTNLLPTLLIFGVLIFFFMKQSNGGGALEVGKSKAKLSESKKKVTYKNVAGLEEEKQELIEIVDFLKGPEKFTKMGARIPKGVLLVGPPGTGKTLLAKSVAGEAGVPFYFISGSDFLEMFVGVGASRVRDMFKKAKANSPCLIFIDEIDAIARQRGSGIGGGHDEREQTLNQILVEMDGFEGNEGVIILAATNRADVLDPAILRPGRFDRQVMVNLPTVKERANILKLHAENKTFEKDVDFDLVSARTPGFSGADLENVLNEAALLAVREEKTQISTELIDEAIDRVMMGPAKKSKKYTDHEKKLVAHHEAGHVVCGLVLDNASDVHKVTIIPRGMAGGYALMLPKEERFFSTRTELIERINGLLAGRVSEELIFNEVSTGAHNDFEQATKIARAMVTEYGMSDLGPIQWEKPQGSVFLGRDYASNKNFSDSIAREIDHEVRNIITEAYKKTTSILNENMGLLKTIANELMEKEILNKEDIDKIYFDVTGIRIGSMIEEKQVEEEKDENAIITQDNIEDVEKE